MTITNVSIDIPPLWGRSLRFVLVDEIERRSQVTVNELVTALQTQGFSVEGRASKTISDALRWEVARGRVVRVGRGVYQYRSAPSSTARRIRLFAKRCRAWVVAMTRTKQPPPNPPKQWQQAPIPPADRQHPTSSTSSQPRWPNQAGQPDRPPWEHLGWLWNS